MKVKFNFEYELDKMSDSPKYDFIEKQIEIIATDYGIKDKWDLVPVDLQVIPNVGEHISFNGGDLYLITGISHHVDKRSQDIILFAKYDS